VVVAGKAEGMVAVEPSMIGMAPAIGFVQGVIGGGVHLVSFLFYESYNSFIQSRLYEWFKIGVYTYIYSKKIP
jgi:hypothetical protein